MLRVWVDFWFSIVIIFLLFDQPDPFPFSEHDCYFTCCSFELLMNCNVWTCCAGATINQNVSQSIKLLNSSIHLINSCFSNHSELANWRIFHWLAVYIPCPGLLSSLLSSGLTWCRSGQHSTFPPCIPTTHFSIYSWREVHISSHQDALSGGTEWIVAFLYPCCGSIDCPVWLPLLKKQM